MKQKILILTASLLAPLATLHATAKTNFVFIMADDLGWTDTATYGSQYHETPNIDRLAAQGMKFTRFYNCQNCAPSRAALMSGQYAARTGIYTVAQLL
jgi:arylsulfatase A-like enzyme